MLLRAGRRARLRLSRGHADELRADARRRPGDGRRRRHRRRRVADVLRPRTYPPIRGSGVGGGRGRGGGETPWQGACNVSEPIASKDWQARRLTCVYTLYFTSCKIQLMYLCNKINYNCNIPK